MNILSIGNSFSEDATRYLHQIASEDGCDITTVNLYIGGCSLSRHFRNMNSDEKEYELQYNGVKTGFSVSIKEALLNREWDYVTFQQVSNLSVDYESYQPYLNELVAYVKKYAPNAKPLIHQTWSYEKDSYRLCDEMGYKKHQDMFADIEKAYENAAKDIGACFILTSGKLFEKLLSSGIETIHRDTFHAKLGVGRYALGLLWYRMLTGADVTNNQFCKFDEDVSSEEINIVKKCVMTF